MKRAQRGYLAGILDGEGSITATVRTTMGEVHWMFKPQISIPNTHSRGMHYVKTLLEEIVHHPLSLVVQDLGGNSKRQYRVYIQSHEDVLLVLGKLLPDLVIKKDQANLLFQHLEWRLKQPRKAPIKSHCRYDWEVYERDLVVLQRLHALNGSPRTRTDFTEILRQIKLLGVA